MCQECLRQGRFTACISSDPVDHRIPLWEGGSEAESNQELLCQACHDVKTSAEARRRGGGG